MDFYERDNMKKRLIIKNKRFVLLIIALTSFLTPFMNSSINIALPSIAKEFSMDAILLSWVTTSYLLSTVIFLVPFGKIADIKGRKKIYTYGILIYTISSFLSIVAKSALLLICFQILLGIGSAMIFSTSYAILTSVFKIDERGKALGINAAAAYLGLSLGPFLGGFLTQNLGWRSIFMMNIILGVIINVLILLKLKGERSEAKREKFDFIGSIIYSFVLILIIYGLSLLPELLGFLSILVGVLGIFAFIKWETKTENPILNVNIFKNNKLFAFSNLAALINYSATFAITFFLNLYLQHIKAYSPQQAGLILVSQPIVMAIFSPIAGRISDNIEPRIISSIGMIITTTGLINFTFFSEKTTLYFIIANLIILGFGIALFTSPNTNAIMSSVEKRYYGVASAMVGTMRLIGQMLSMGIAMLVFSIFIGKAQITVENYMKFLNSMKIAFIVFAIICFFNIFISLLRGKVHKN